MLADFLAKPRWLSLASLLALGSVSAAGCASPDESVATDDGIGSSTDDITQVNHSKVKRQSIGNCWIYAVLGWVEALNKAATGVEKNTSESWLTYWHWFDQIANGQAGSEIATGGFYATGVNLILRYGVVAEGDFIASESEAEMSNRQSTALDAINRSLKEGALKDPAARRDRAVVRKELDRAWQLDAATSAKIDTVFGTKVERTLDRSFSSREPGNGILRAKDIPVKLKDPQTRAVANATLADAIGTGTSVWAPREGKFAWQQVDYPSAPQPRREFWKRVQRALHDQAPVVMAWRVDFNALTRDSRFSLDELRRLGPGRQGGHMVLMHDYQADVPGVGLLKAGEPATPQQMEAALADGTKIQFIRIKNSWGGLRPDRWSTAVIAGYHDVDMAYLDGPIKECGETPAGENPDPATCTRDVVPLWDVVLPAGY